VSTEVSRPLSRRELVRRAVADWRNALIDLGGRNNLLHYRDLRRGTLDFAEADPTAIEALLVGKAVTISALYRDPEQREQVLRRVRTLHNKAKENFEERGLETLSIGCGLASWENKRSTWRPCAPVLLRQAALRPLGAAQDEFQLSLVGEIELNPTLLHVLKLDFDCELDRAALDRRIPDGVIDEPWELDETYEWITEQGRRVPDFAVDRRMVLANFAYAKLAMVTDLDGALEELVEHDLIAAIAGDEAAREVLRAQRPGPDAMPSPDQTPLADEFLVLDADSSQNYAINATLGGQSLIVKGPPGTGKSQTIANLIASLVARNKKVLFVAEKRAAIEAVTKRLDQQKLGELVLDLHGGVTSRRAFAQSVGQALSVSQSARRVDNSAELAYVEKRRAELNSYVRTLHQTREPWGLSVYAIRAGLIGLESASTDVRFRGSVLERLDETVIWQAEDDLGKYAQLGGLTVAGNGSPWASSPVVSTDQVQQAAGCLDEILHHALPNTLALATGAADETGIASPGTISGWVPLIDLWTRISATLTVFAPSVYGLDLQETCAALEPAGRGGFARIAAAITSGPYKAARANVRRTVTGGEKLADRRLYVLIGAARDEARQWVEVGGSESPRAPQRLKECAAAHRHLLDLLGQLQVWAGQPRLPDMTTTDCEYLLRRLDADRVTLGKLPELHRLRTGLTAAGLGAFLGAMAASQASAEFAVRSLRYAWLRSILDHLSLADPAVESFSAEAHDATVEKFSNGDRAHIEATYARIRRVYAENAVIARDAFPGEAALVAHQAGLKRRHMPVRDFVRSAIHVLLALKPCWVMSPLEVSQLLPAKPVFDVVIFDEASQITPADAVTSILRGKQLVVAGDDKQLPPTAFFVSDNADDEDAEDTEATEPQIVGPVPLTAGTKGFESILDALGPLLGFRMLCWHYRSNDERLIAFSNAHIYDWALTTFPGVGGQDVLSYVPVPWAPGSDTNSPTPEVNAVVDLILQHARRRPDESLGVITMGIKHSNRIEEALRQRLRDDPSAAADLADFFDESKQERFFVKNLERVQGDERDAIILSIGYGKNARGDLPYRFGPLLMDGGERRLNVAVTRAKDRLTLVSSFSSGDMDPDRSNAEGVKLLRQYLQYVESGGTNLGDHIVDKPALNPFEIDVRDTLTRRGLRLTPQYGSSGYWIDYAVQHPLQPGRYVLAIECDGATYHSSQSARDRDRLRQEQLERKGWRFHRIWSSEWFHNKDACAEKAVAAYEKAVLAADEDKLASPASAPRPRYESPQADLHSATSRVASRPYVVPGYPIEEYSDFDLRRLATWIRSDDVLRTEDELLAEMMRELGFQRRGKNVVARLAAAIRASKPR
jgi:very-short-patch-repair endonuclease